MDMQRVAGFIMIFVGCLGLGVWYSSQFQSQINVLKEFCRILELFSGEVRFSRCSLPECCLRLSQKMEEPYRRSFYEIYEKMCENNGECFGELCRENLEKGLKEVVANEADKTLFINCFVNSGYEDDVLQLRMIEQSKKELEERLTLLMAENTSKCRLALGLGAMSGLLLIILFL